MFSDDCMGRACVSLKDLRKYALLGPEKPIKLVLENRPGKKDGAKGHIMVNVAMVAVEKKAPLPGPDVDVVDASAKTGASGDMCQEPGNLEEAMEKMKSETELKAAQKLSEQKKSLEAEAEAKKGKLEDAGKRRSRFGGILSKWKR